MKNAKGCFGSDVVAWSIRSHMTQLDTRQWWWRVTSWVKHEALLQDKIRTCSKITAVLLLCTDDDNRSYRNVCNMSFVSFSLAVVFITRLFSTSAFRVPNLSVKSHYEFTCTVRDMKYTSQHFCGKTMDVKWPYNVNVVFRIVQNHDEKVTFVGFRGDNRPPGSAPVSRTSCHLTHTSHQKNSFLSRF